MSTSQNRNARIVSRFDKNGKLRTETTNRDVGTTKLAVSTNVSNMSTTLFIDVPINDDILKLGSHQDDVRFAHLRLDGRQARSLYRLLRKHYG